MKKIRVNPNTREIAAYHEAGHAVMHMLFKDEIIYVSIDESGNGFVSCPVQFPTTELSLLSKYFDKMDPAEVDIIMINFVKKLKKYSMCNIAGYCAEFRFLKRPMPWGLGCSDNDENDFSKIRAEISKANEALGKTVLGEMDLYLWDKATRYELRKSKVWETIEDIANELLDSKDGKILPSVLESIFLNRLTPYLNRKFHTSKF